MSHLLWKTIDAELIMPHMKITPGVYRTAFGDRAVVVAVAPADVTLGEVTHYAIGWIVFEGTWMPASWSETGQCETRGNDLVIEP